MPVCGLRLITSLLVLTATAGRVAGAEAGRPDARINFERDVRPILERSCVSCHGPRKQEGGLRLDVAASAFRERDSGEPAVRPGDAESPLLARVTSHDASERMPPEGDRLPADEIELLRRWIASGADWPEATGDGPAMTPEEREHWPFRPLGLVAVPEGPGSPRAANPVDRFLLAALRAESLAPSPPADRRVLIRRVYFDLIGLPPSPGVVDEFISDPDPLAYEKLVDRLLTDPRFGERWGRHWLDVARYADSNGQEGDQDRPNAYRYRDFVIRAINDDLPYDTFVRWQLAGDEIAPEDPLAIAATGFVVAGPHTVLDVPMEEEKVRNRFNELDDMLATTGSAFLGLTLGCARCHDHKYDPVPTRDYYRMLAAFTAGDRAEVPVPGTDGATTLAMRDFGPQPRETWLFDRGDFRSKAERVELGFLTVLTGEKPAEAYLAEARSAGTRKDTTYQRQAVAEWMTDLEGGAGPLVARVIVNRLWQHHFGEGLVRTVNDFGTQGERPSHPELLDWLAGELVRNGWRLKPVHRLILTSAAYTRSTADDPANAAADPENRRLWRRRPVRVEAEILRDAMLATSGRLNPGLYGPAFKPFIPAEAMQARNVKTPYPADVEESPATLRRTVYLFHKRVIPYPLLQAFDGPDAAASCGRRNVTTVAPQALAVLNDPFVRGRAEDFARRLENEAGTDTGEQVEHAFRLALSRPPSEAERLSTVEFVNRQTARRLQRQDPETRTAALADFCQVLYGLNEFLYVD